MPETVTSEGKPKEFISVDDALPDEEGGSAAREGFNYQDEIAVGFLIELLEDPTLLKVHCETHDDILLVRETRNPSIRIVEFVQVKAIKPNKLWSLADLCTRKRRKKGTSIFETSLFRDKHHEVSRFRLVTLRPVVKELEVLTFPYDRPGREADGIRLKALQKKLDKKFPGIKSEKGNGVTYWLTNCKWDQRDSEKAVCDDNLIRLIRLSIKEGTPILPEFADELLDELRSLAKSAGAAKWEPDRDKKIITRDAIREWWEKRTRELIDGATMPSGGKLRKKMTEAGLPHDLIELAVELRFDYASAARVSHYMVPEEKRRLQRLVKAELVSLRSRYVAGLIALDSVGFHAFCLDRMEMLNAECYPHRGNQSVFLKGYMYDIVDRCLLRFDRPSL